MDTGNSQLGWSEAQWSRVTQAVTEEFTKASVAGAVLPCYGPLAESAESVRQQALESQVKTTGSEFRVDDDDVLKFWTLRVFVHLKHEQVRDDTLASALLAFRRAANLLARTEDHIVFNGYDNTEKARYARAGSSSADVDGVISGDISSKGLLERAVARVNRALTVSDIVKIVAEAVGELDVYGYPGPFACVLGNGAFVEAHSPTPSMVMPADRITPILKGSLLRCGQVPGGQGIVISMAGEPIDLVVATAPKVQFLQVNQEARYVFRVYERFILRVKDPRAIAAIGFKP